MERPLPSNVIALIRLIAEVFPGTEIWWERRWRRIRVG